MRRRDSSIRRSGAKKHSLWHNAEVLLNSGSILFFSRQAVRQIEDKIAYMYLM